MPSAPAEQDLWIRRFHQVPDATYRLVCFPHAGGGASFYHSMSAALARQGIAVLAVQYPGRQDRHREPVIDTIAELADRLCPVLSGELDKPTAFFGHSMGAIVAFELALRIAAETDGNPVRCYLSGRRAPGTERAENVHQLDDRGILAELNRLSGTDARVLAEPELLNRLLPVIRNDYRAIETYRGRRDARLRCPLTVLIGAADPKTTLDEARAWRGHTTGDFSLEIFAGGHFYLADHQQAVVERITADLGAR